MEYNFFAITRTRNREGLGTSHLHALARGDGRGRRVRVRDYSRRRRGESKPFPFSFLSLFLNIPCMTEKSGRGPPFSKTAINARNVFGRFQNGINSTRHGGQLLHR